MDIFSNILGRSKRDKRTYRDLKVYLSQRYDLLKLELIEKSSQMLSVILSIVIVVICALAVLIYLSSALISWLTLALNAAWAYTIICAVFILIIVVVLMMRDRLFVRPFIRKFSRIFYPEKNETDTTAEFTEVTEEKGGDNE